MCGGNTEQGFDMCNLPHNIQNLPGGQPKYTHDGPWIRIAGLVVEVGGEGRWGLASKRFGSLEFSWGMTLRPCLLYTVSQTMTMWCSDCPIGRLAKSGQRINLKTSPLF